MKTTILITYYFLSLLLMLYIGLYWGLIEPIMNVAEMIDADAITAKAVAWELCKVLLREFVTLMVGIILFTFGTFLTTKTFK